MDSKASVSWPARSISLRLSTTRPRGNRNVARARSLSTAARAGRFMVGKPHLARDWGGKFRRKTVTTEIQPNGTFASHGAIIAMNSRLLGTVLLLHRGSLILARATGQPQHCLLLGMTGAGKTPFRNLPRPGPSPLCVHLYRGGGLRLHSLREGHWATRWPLVRHYLIRNRRLPAELVDPLHEHGAVPRRSHGETLMIARTNNWETASAGLSRERTSVYSAPNSGWHSFPDFGQSPKTGNCAGLATPGLRGQSPLRAAILSNSHFTGQTLKDGREKNFEIKMSSTKAG